jgi:hypothetical protein
MSELIQPQSRVRERTSERDTSTPDPRACQLMRALATVLLDIAANPGRGPRDPGSPTAHGAAQRSVR